MAKIMTLAEAETCEQAYVLYDIEDPVVHLFTRLKTWDEWITFERPLEKFPGAKCQPNLWKHLYYKVWVAFDEEPSEAQIALAKRRLTVG